MRIPARVRRLNWITIGLLVLCVLVLCFGCVSVKPNTLGTVVSKDYKAMPVTTLTGRVLARVVVRSYIAVIQLDEIPEGMEINGDNTLRICLCDADTWEALVVGQQYRFCVVDAEIKAVELIE